MLAASPLVLLAAQVAQYELSARDLQAQARAKVRTVLPQLADGTDPLPAIRAQLSGLQAGDRFGHTVGALLSAVASAGGAERSEEHTSELQSLMRLSDAVFCLKKK